MSLSLIGFAYRFQSTHPVRGATIVRIMLFKIRVISIHAPREGCDQSTENVQRVVSDFNPRTP